MELTSAFSVRDADRNAARTKGAEVAASAERLLASLRGGGEPSSGTKRPPRNSSSLAPAAVMYPDHTANLAQVSEVKLAFRQIADDLKGWKPLPHRSVASMAADTDTQRQIPTD
ncbi:hypothetical protein [Tardiphaga sp. 862_B3_N1_1]|uniref:hypothetical protein n=1 Tax=Tardiphaga sp. 862_B3_N1_1 TaxID=3240763 RepID=UPI003F8B3FB3